MNVSWKLIFVAIALCITWVMFRSIVLYFALDYDYDVLHGFFNVNSILTYFHCPVILLWEYSFILHLLLSVVLCHE